MNNDIVAVPEVVDGTSVYKTMMGDWLFPINGQAEHKGYIELVKNCKAAGKVAVSMGRGMYALMDNKRGTA